MIVVIESADRTDEISKVLAFRYLLVLTLVTTTTCAKTAYALTGNALLAIEIFSSGILVAIPLLLALYGRWIQSIGLLLAGISNRDNIITVLSQLLDSLGNDPNVARTVIPIVRRIKNGIVHEYAIEHSESK